MRSLRRILAATDFSIDAGHALSRAKAIAAEHGTGLSLVHVIDASALDALKSVFLERPAVEEELLAAARSALDELAAEAAGQNLRVETAVLVGGVLDQLLAAAQSSELIVLGAHGVNKLRDRIIGTTAERLLGRCATSIIVTRREAESAYGRVLVPVDLSAYSAAALAEAVRIAPHAEFHVLHVYDAPFEGKLWLAGVAQADIERYCAEVRTQALEQLHTLVDAQLPGGHRTIITAERGEAAFKILDAASWWEADLIVVGKRGLSPIGDMLLGSVTRHVLADAECDVLVVPRPALSSSS